MEPTLRPVFSPVSLKKSNMASVKVTSFGEGRKNHCSPRCVRLGEELSAET